LFASNPEYWKANSGSCNYLRFQSVVMGCSPDFK